MSGIVYRVQTRDPAQLSNRMQAQGWHVRHMRAVDGGVEFGLSIAQGTRAQVWLAENGYSYRILYRRGAKERVKTAARHAGLWIGIALCAIVVTVMQGYCLYTDVRCASDPELAQQVEAYLAEQNIYGVIPKRAIDCDALAKALVERDERIAFAQCYFVGGRLIAEITPDHTVPPTPDVYKRLVATQDAVVTRVLTTSGTALVQEGAVVRAGDVLVDGYLIIGNPEDPAHERIEVPANGTVYGRVWYHTRLYIADEYVVNVRTGNEKTVRTTSLGKWTIGKPESPFGQYETETTIQRMSAILPLTVTTYKFYETQSVRVRTDEQARAIAIAQAQRELASQIPTDAKVLATRNLEKRLDNATQVDIYYEIEQSISCGRTD